MNINYYEKIKKNLLYSTKKKYFTHHKFGSIREAGRVKTGRAGQFAIPTILDSCYRRCPFLQKAYSDVCNASSHLNANSLPIGPMLYLTKPFINCRLFHMTISTDGNLSLVYLFVAYMWSGS